MLLIRLHFVCQGGDLFPSRVSADEYFQAEEEFAVSLTGFTKRQFFEVSNTLHKL